MPNVCSSSPRTSICFSTTREGSPSGSAQVVERVGHRAADANLEVQVGAEGEAGVADEADDLPLHDVLADADVDRGLVRVAGGDAAAVVDAGVVAVAAVRSGEDHGS